MLLLPVPMRQWRYLASLTHQALSRIRHRLIAEAPSQHSQQQLGAQSTSHGHASLLCAYSQTQLAGWLMERLPHARMRSERARRAMSEAGAMKAARDAAMDRVQGLAQRVSRLQGVLRICCGSEAVKIHTRMPILCMLLGLVVQSLDNVAPC